MANFEQRDLSGALFANAYKEGNPKRPDLTGTAVVNGDEYKVSAWKKVSKNGKGYLSLSFQLKEDENINNVPTDIDDAIPF